MLKIEQFLRAMTAKQGSNIKNSPVKELPSVLLPSDSIIHYITDTPADFGIRGGNMMLQRWDKGIRVCFIEDGYGDVGKPRFKKVSSSAIIRSYRAKQKRFRVQPNWERAITAKDTLVVFDYSILAAKYSYTNNINKFYNEWQNTTTAMLSKVSLVGSHKNHFIHVKMPEHWPSLAKFGVVTDSLTASHLEEWVTPSHFWLREIWRLIHGTGELAGLKGLKGLYFILSEGTNAVFLSASDLVERANTGGKDMSDSLSKSFYGLCENLIRNRTTMDNGGDTEEDVEDDNRFDTTVEKEIIAGIPNTTLEIISDLADAGKLTVAEQTRLINIAQRSEDLKDPFGSGQTIKELINITPEQVAIKPALNVKANKLTIPAHATESTTMSLRRDYVKNGLVEKHTIAMLNNLKRSGLFIQDYSVEDKIDAVNNATVLKLKLLPVNGKASTQPIEMPVIEENGTFLADGVRYSMDAQKVDVPIRKTAYNKAALTSYYGKIFIQRSVIAKNDYNRWLASSLRKAGLEAGDSRVTKIHFGGNLVPNKVLPREYTAIMPTVSSFISGTYEFYFDYDHRFVYLDEKAVKDAEKSGRIACGRQGGVVLTMDSLGTIYKGKESLGYIMDVLGGGWGKRPNDIAEMMVYGKRAPVGLVLGYYLGLDRLLKRIKAKTRTLPSNLKGKANVSDDELMIEFRDVTLFVKTDDVLVSLIMAGFNASKGATRNFNYSDFNKKGVYGPILKGSGLEQHHIKELKMIRELFVDPITYDILVDMHEPTGILDLIVRCVDLIRTDDAPDETDPRFMRRRGLERVSGFVYKAMVNGIREQRNKPNPSIHPVNIGPKDAWMAMTQDPTVQLVKDLNPVHTLKEQEGVSLSGEGGRGAVSLVKKSRVFHEKDIGVFSESTPASGKVGIRTYLSANAKTKNLYGMYTPFDFEQDGSTSVLSTTSLLLPAMHHDDPKRMNLGSVQQSAVVPARGYVATPLRTGYESVIGSRLEEPFVYTAEEDGEVVKINESLLQIKYASGTKKGWKIGVFHGVSDGESIPHDIVSDLTKGHKFTTGDVLAWNQSFFERDFFSPTNVVMKTGAIARTALLENNDTLEDGSKISVKMQGLLTTRTCKRKAIHLKADQIITDLVKVGDTLEYDSPLCKLQEGSLGEFGETDASLVALGKLAGSNPKAKYAGKVTRIEVFYMGDYETMSESIQEIVVSDNERRAKDKKDTGKRISATGEVKRSTFVSGEKITMDTVVIVIYIDHDLEQGVGDKAVFGNQLKTIHGSIMTGVNKTEDGKDIDAIFGYRSVNDRIVNSPVIQGTVNSTLYALSARFARIYRTGKA